MTIFDLFMGKKKKNISEEKVVSSPVKLNNKNIVYPKNNQEEEINKLYDEIKNYNNLPKNEKLKNRYVSNALNNNRYLQKQQSTFIPEKEKYKKMEEDFNKLMHKGDDIFKKDEY